VVLGLAGLLIGRLGETTWAPETERTATVDLSDPGPAVVIDPGVLYVGGTQGDVKITADSDVSVITASNDDIDAYLDGVQHTQVTGLSDWSTLKTKTVDGDDDSISDPTSSDLWRSVKTSKSPTTIDIGDFYAEETSTDPQPYRAILLVTDGTKPGAGSISITWPVDEKNEWVPFVYAAGATLIIVGLVMLVVSFGSARREREREEAGEDSEELEADDAHEGERQPAAAAASASAPAAGADSSDADSTGTAPGAALGGAAGLGAAGLGAAGLGAAGVGGAIAGTSDSADEEPTAEHGSVPDEEPTAEHESVRDEAPTQEHESVDAWQLDASGSQASPSAPGAEEAPAEHAPEAYDSPSAEPAPTEHATPEQALAEPPSAEPAPAEPPTDALERIDDEPATAQLSAEDAQRPVTAPIPVGGADGATTGHDDAEGSEDPTEVIDRIEEPIAGPGEDASAALPRRTHRHRAATPEPENGESHPDDAEHEGPEHGSDTEEEQR
jgi:hypothetical protein